MTNEIRLDHIGISICFLAVSMADSYSPSPMATDIKAQGEMSGAM